MSDKPGRPKAAIAAEAWSALLDLTMGQRNRFFGVLQALRDALARLPTSLRATGPHERPPDSVSPHRLRA